MTNKPKADAATRLRALGLGEEDLAAWRESGLAISELDGWLTDRVARRPTGSHARAVYGGESIHDFARRAILEALSLRAGDRLLDVGCGGGLLLRDAMAQGAKAVGLDHSPDMVELARERAPGATLVLGTAQQLPFEDESFTAVSMSVVFFFFDDPLGALKESRRVLRRGGRLAVYTSGPEMRGMDAAPEPIASLGHWYTDEELAELARHAGYAELRVIHERGGQLLVAVAPPS